MRNSFLHTTAVMGTVVTIEVVGHDESPAAESARSEAVQRAAGWFQHVHDCCTRFDPRSELSRLTAQVGRPVTVSTLLHEAVRFALAVAEETDGAFDPTIGHRMEERGFNREQLTGLAVQTAGVDDRDINYRDVHVDPHHPRITLRKALLLDLGAVAKGLAVDMAVRELEAFGDFAIDAGGDLFLGGRNREGLPWSVGIRHPREPDQVLTTLHVTNRAVCTSGGYQRPVPGRPGEHHVIDPRTGASGNLLMSATVVAPSAMVADALATAAFVLGPVEGLALLERHGVDGLLLTPTMDRIMTGALPLA